MKGALLDLALLCPTTFHLHAPIHFFTRPQRLTGLAPIIRRRAAPRGIATLLICLPRGYAVGLREGGRLRVGVRQRVLSVC